jgi:hypothetical protein
MATGLREILMKVAQKVPPAAALAGIAANQHDKPCW